MKFFNFFKEKESTRTMKQDYQLNVFADINQSTSVIRSTSFGNKIIEEIEVFDNTTLTQHKKEMMLKDDVISQSLDELKIILGSTKMEVFSPINDESHPDFELLQKITKFVKYAFNEYLEISFSEVIYNMFSSIENKISITETVFKKIEGGEFNNFITWKTWKTRKEEYENQEFTIKTDSYGNINKIIQNNIEIPIENILIHRAFPDGSSVLGISPLDKIEKVWIKKRYIEGLQMMYLELASRIHAIAKMGDTNESIEQDILTALKNLVEGGISVLPKGIEVEIKEIVKDGDKGFRDAIEQKNDAIRRFFLSRKLLADAPKMGTQALGKVQDELSQSLPEFLLKTFADGVLQTAIKRLVDLNFKNISFYPRIVFGERVKNSEIRSKIIKSLVESGVINPETETNEIREYLGLWRKPIIEGSNKNETLPKQGTGKSQDNKNKIEQSETQLQEFTQTGETYNIGTTKTFQDIKKDVELFIPKKLDFSSRNKFDGNTNYSKMVKDTDEIIKTGVDFLSKSIADNINSVLNKIEKNNIIAEKQYKEIDSFVFVTDDIRKRLFMDMSIAFFNGMEMGLSELKKKTNSKNITFNRNIKLSEMNTGINKALKFFKEPFLDGTISKKEVTQRIPLFKEVFKTKSAQNKALSLFDDKAFSIKGLLKSDIEQKIKPLIFSAIENAQDFQTFKNVVNEKSLRYTKDIYGGRVKKGEPVKPYHTETIYRNNIFEAYRRGRESLFKSAGDFVEALEYSAVLDNRTRPNHEAMNGTVKAIDDPWWSINNPPNGHNCRCITIPITKFEKWSPSSNPTIVNKKTGVKIETQPDSVEWGAKQNINPFNFKLK